MAGANDRHGLRGRQSGASETLLFARGNSRERHWPDGLREVAPTSDGFDVVGAVTLMVADLRAVASLVTPCDGPRRDALTLTV